MKAEAKGVEGFERGDWMTPSQIAMIQCNLEKVCSCFCRREKGNACLQFKQNHQLRLALLRTYGTTLVECNPADQRWGIAMSFTNEEKSDRRVVANRTEKKKVAFQL